MDFKQEITELKLNRRVLANRLNMSYSNFNGKLGKFTPFTCEQENSLRQIISQARAVRLAEKENAPDPIYRG